MGCYSSPVKTLFEEVGENQVLDSCKHTTSYSLSQFQPLFLYSFAELRISDPVLFGIIYNLIFSVSKPAGGVLFGIAFWTVSRHLTNKTVKTYMIISAYGMTLLFAADQPISLILIPYPPFGLVSICFMVMATYLVYLGIYSSALLVLKTLDCVDRFGILH